MLKFYFAICGTLYFINFAAAKDFYFITMPKVLLAETSHQISFHSSKDLLVKIITYHTESRIKDESAIFRIKKGISLIPYQLPFYDKSNDSSISLRFLGDICDEITKSQFAQNIIGKYFNQTRPIKIISKNFIIFSETDKPIYKPGEMIKLRFMPIYPTNLKTDPPASFKQKVIVRDGKTNYKLVNNDNEKTFDLIIIENPFETRVAQWRNLTIINAMNLIYQLSKDPAIGSWKAKASYRGQEEVVQFNVMKYVLPRFIVDIIPPSQIMNTDTSIKYEVCAQYSTKKRMVARIQTAFCIIYDGDSEKCQVTNVILKNIYCVTIDVLTKNVILPTKRNPFYFTTSKINATVTENGTLSAISKSLNGVGIMYSQYKIVFNSKPYFKYGLPYFGNVKLIRHDNKPQTNAKVKVSVEFPIGYNRWGFHSNYTSDENGVIKFIIPSITSTSPITIQIEDATNEKFIMNSKFYQNIDPWESTSEQVLEILPIESKIKCPGELNLTVLTNYDISSTNLFVQMLSRGQIVKAIEYPPVPIKCHSRDDDLGHYTCVDGKSLNCLSGWKGNDCLEPICSQGCVNGACVKQDKCICKIGWTGKTCNKCIKPHYCKNGNCLRGNDCECLPGWTGFYCSIKYYKYDNKSLTISRNKYTNLPSKPILINKYEKKSIFERNLSIPLFKDMGPDIHVIVYFINAELEVIVDTVELTEGLESCAHVGGGEFKFDKDVAVPKSNVILNIDPGMQNAPCAVRIADIALSQFGKSSNVDLPYLVQKIIYINHKVTNYENDDSNCVFNQFVRSDHFPQEIGFDSDFILKKSGFKAVTNARIVNKICKYQRTFGELKNSFRNSMKITLNTDSEFVKLELEEKTHVREYFPESWIFNYFNQTAKQLFLTVPDSMTTWQANSFCMTENGIWIATPQTLKVQKLFFSDIYVPYSMKLNERLRLPIKLFNYVDSCFEIHSEISANSNEIYVIGLTSFTICLCSNEEKTIYFNIEPKQIGKLNITIHSSSRYSSFCSNENEIKTTNVEMFDSVRRQLLVEPPGVPTETTYSEIICNKNEQLGVSSVFTIPSEIVSGSLRSYLTFNGDVMGKTFDNLDKLVVMPYGCGEQNMVAVVPSIYVLEYLDGLNINNPALAARAKGYIIDGYTRQLTYKHADGSFSAFGTSDKSGSTWLTAFVLKSFTDASKYVDIKDSILIKAKTYLENVQKPDGCFEEKGKLLHSTMAGNVKKNDNTDSSLLTAYVLISIKRLKLAKSYFNISQAIKCISKNLEKDSSNFRLALTAYVLSLYDRSSNLTQKVTDKLLAQSVSFGRYKYWPFDKESYDEQKSNSADIETTGYALLALINYQDLSESLKTVYWLSNQQNSLGGYYSTQDTVVALNALAVFAKTIGLSQNVNLNVSIVLNHNKTYNGLITPDNRLVSRKFNLGTENISYVSIRTNGSGCASVQLSSLYNIHKLYSANDTFKLSVKTENESVSQCNNRNIKVCFAYLRQDKNSNMILVIINYPSGWELSDEEKKSLSLQVSTPLNRIDFQKTRMELYYDAFSYNDAGKDSCFRFRLEERTKISNLQPTLVKIVDYYNPEIYTEKSYSMFNKACNETGGKKPDPRKVLLCPICVNDSVNSTLRFIRTICGAWFNGFVSASSTGSQMRTVFVAGQSLFQEWNLDLEHKNCSCLRSWKYFNKRFVILSSQWESLSDKLTLSNYSVMFPVETLYSAYQFDLQGQCRIANYLYSMVSRLVADFANKSQKNDSCPKCILGNNYYFLIKNITQWYCANYTDWKLNITSISPVVMGVLTSNESSIPVELEVPHQFCYCYEHIRDVKKSFRIIDLNRKLQSLNQKSDKPIKLALNKGFEVVEENVFSSFKLTKCV